MGDHALSDVFLGVRYLTGGRRGQGRVESDERGRGSSDGGDEGSSDGEHCGKPWDVVSSCYVWFEVVVVLGYD